jgi:lysine 2,3-aminomutase
MIEALDTPRALWVAVHANHADEFGADQRTAIRSLARAGIGLLGQSVLLKDVNDDPATLEALFRTMVECRIKPYYLHHPDLAPGTAHFRLPIERGQAIVRALRGRLSGLAQPTHVLDIPGGHGKVPLTPMFYRDGKVEDWRGGVHDYPPTAQETDPQRRNDA